MINVTKRLSPAGADAIIQASYVETGAKPIPRIHLKEDAYREALQRFIPACTDIVFVNRDEKRIVLAHRRSKPIADTWWFIGGGMFPGESLGQAAARNLERETKLVITPERLTLIGVFDYQCRDSAQSDEIGCHMLGLTHAVELSVEEIARAAISLDPHEYVAEDGLRSFAREDIVEHGLHPVMLDVYDRCFPSRLAIVTRPDGDGPLAPISMYGTGG